MCTMSVEPAERPVYRFGGFTLDLSREVLLDVDGSEVPLRPKSFALLGYLVERPGRLVDRTELMATLWPGIRVVDNSLAQCVHDVRRALGDGEQRLLRTLPRRGYLFTAPVCHAAPAAAAAASGAQWPANDDTLPRPPANRPMVVVLPLEGVGARAGQRYFAAGLNADLVTDLTRYQVLHVVSPPAPRAAPAAAAAYAVGGEVRCDGGRVRVTAHLDDARTGVRLWAERFDRPLGDLFAVQAELAASIAARLVARVEQEGLRRALRRPPSSLDTYDLLLRGRDLHHRTTEMATLEARAMFARAIEADPAYALAHAWQAFTLQRGFSQWWGEPRGRAALPAALAHAQRAVELEPEFADLRRSARLRGGAVRPLGRGAGHRADCGAAEPRRAPRPRELRRGAGPRRRRPGGGGARDPLRALARPVPPAAAARNARAGAAARGAPGRGLGGAAPARRAAARLRAVPPHDGGGRDGGRAHGRGTRRVARGAAARPALDHAHHRALLPLPPPGRRRAVPRRLPRRRAAGGLTGTRFRRRPRSRQGLRPARHPEPFRPTSIGAATLRVQQDRAARECSPERPRQRDRTALSSGFRPAFMFFRLPSRDVAGPDGCTRCGGRCSRHTQPLPHNGRVPRTRTAARPGCAHKGGRFPMLNRIRFQAIWLALAVAPAAMAAEPPLTDEQKIAVEQLIHDYYIDHPEALVEAVQRAQSAMRARAQAEARRAVAERHGELVSDPQAPVAGNPRGDVTLVEFFDYRCAYCKKSQPALAALRGEDAGLRIVHKQLPVLGPNSVFAARAALAAAGQGQGRYEAFHEALMAATGPLDRGVVLGIAGSVGLDRERLARDMAAPEVDAALAKNAALAKALGVNGTPAFVVGETLVPGAAEPAALRHLVAAQRQQGGGGRASDPAAAGAAQPVARAR